MNKNEADEIVEKGLSRLNLKAESDAKRRAKTLNVPYMDKDELNKLVDRGLLRLSKKAEIQAEEKANEEYRKLIIGGACVLFFIVLYCLDAWIRIKDQGDYTRMVWGILGVFVVNILFCWYKCISNFFKRSLLEKYSKIAIAYLCASLFLVVLMHFYIVYVRVKLGIF